MPGRHKIIIEADVARAWSLPAQLYFDPQIFSDERDRIFSRTWQVVGRSYQVSKPGDYFTAEVAGEPVLIARGNDGALRGFYNVCRHRAGPPAEGCGSRKIFRCGYHGWTYSLEGRLLSAPEMEGVENFNHEEFGLRPLRCEEWQQWVFANLDPEAVPLVEELSELSIQASKFPLSEMHFLERRDYRMQCNWKTYVDNYLEGYHLPSVHPGLNRELDYASYSTRQFERHSVQFSPIRDAKNEASHARRYKSAEGLSAQYYWIFPNWMLNCYPDNVSINIIVPLGPEETLAIFEWYLTEEAAKDPAARDAVRFSDEIQLEDGRICEVVQRNLHSRSYQRGRYSAKQERCVHHFHRLYAESMNASRETESSPSEA